MRGDERVQDGRFSCVTLEQRVPQDHPLRAIRKLTDTVLQSLSAGFDALYSISGRPSIAPEYVLRALLLQAFYSVRSERQLVEQLDYNLLFRWFVGLGMDDAVWNHAVFSKNRDRLLNRRSGAAVLYCGERAGEAVHVGRSFHRGWHADPGMGLAQELPREGRLGLRRSVDRRHRRKW